MAGTKSGGLEAARTNYAKYGKNFYKEIGAKGGRNGTTGGFAYMKATGQLDKIREAARKGGEVSRKHYDHQWCECRNCRNGRSVQA